MTTGIPGPVTDPAAPPLARLAGLSTAVLCPGDLILGDADGVVVIPREAEHVLERARDYVRAENLARDAIREGMRAAEAYARFGVL
jgi:4-hydroxy-4-methyl-2-oxoglutarate aldolase